MLLAKHYGKETQGFYMTNRTNKLSCVGTTGLKGHSLSGLCVPFTYIHMNENKCGEYLSFTAYKSLGLVNSDLQVQAIDIAIEP